MNGIDLFYNAIHQHFRNRISTSSVISLIEGDELESRFEDILNLVKSELLELGLESVEIDSKLSDPFVELKKEGFEQKINVIDLFHDNILPIIYELFLEKVVDYLVGDEVSLLMINLKSKGFLPLEFIIELRNLKKLLSLYPEKRENLRKYIHIQERIIKKFQENKDNIEKLEDIEDPEFKLQLVYLIYRIIHFFNLQGMFDFSHIITYLKENVDDWLIDVPLITLKNPDIYFCGIYLAKQLGVKLNKEKIKEFLLDLGEEAIDRFVCPLIEATDGVYYFIKSTEMTKMRLSMETISRLIKTEKEFFKPNYLQKLETSQLVVILKMYSQLGVTKMEREINAISEEIERRVTPEGIKQFRDGFVSSEATYYVLFNHYMNNTLEKLKDYDILSSIISRIYRNLEFLDFSIDTNYDLISETFYSLESLKLFNCIETKEMIIHLAKYLFPQEIVDKISISKEIIRDNAEFRHLKVSRITGETIY
ncbi:MAG: hypothetical protein ACW96X_07460 [Promethearchaeota archaeon]